MSRSFKSKTIKEGKIRILNSNESFPHNNNEQLVVVIHGINYLYPFVDPLDPLVIAIDEIYRQNADIWIPQLPYLNLVSLKKPETIVTALSEDLNDIWNQRKYKSLRIVGYSLGGIYARAMMLQGIAENRQWSNCQDIDIRLVLLAAVNRGAAVSRHMKPLEVILITVAIWLGRLIKIVLVGYREPTVFSGMRGSKFITRMRLDWLELEKDPNHPVPLTVQLLGSIDDIVSPEDNIDLITGKNFHYLDVPYTGHGDILNMTVKRKVKEKEESVIKDRKKILETALTKTPTEIEKEEVRPWELKRIDKDEQKRRDQVKHVVFVIHGIRDEGHWTDKIARRVWSRAEKYKQVMIVDLFLSFITIGLFRFGFLLLQQYPQKIYDLEKVVHSYGYFGMGPFLIPRVRWKKVTWLMEQYLEAKAKYPQAKYSYIGHSHGTYVLAKALENYKKCQFHNVVFAGSIVRENYDWPKRIKDEQVTRVLNFVATWDSTVAWFPNLLGLYNLQDLGGAGHNGFKQATQNETIYNIKYSEGGHGSGKQEELWDTIADFILMKDGDSLPEDLSTFIDNNESSNLPLTKIELPCLLLRQILGLGNIVVWTLIVTISLVLIPILIVNYWSCIAEFISLLISLVTSTKGLKILFFLAIAFYILNAFRQRIYKRSGWWARSFIFFPMTFGLCFMGARWSINWLLNAPNFQNIQFPSIEMWSPAAIVIWIGFVVWTLSKI